MIWFSNRIAKISSALDLEEARIKESEKRAEESLKASVELFERKKAAYLGFYEEPVIEYLYYGYQVFRNFNAGTFTTEGCKIL